MTSRGISLFLLRGLVFLLWLAGMLMIGQVAWPLPLTSCAAAILAYAFIPRPETPPGGLTYDRMTAIVIPDWMGFILSSLMLALPIWAASGFSGADWVHPMAWLLWPMALVFLFFSVIGWRHEAFLLRLFPNGLLLDAGTRRLDIPWSSIKSVAPWRRDLPRWMRHLAPFLAATGHPLQAGAIMIARESNGLTLVTADRVSKKPITISSDGFDAQARALLQTLDAHDVPIKRGLSHLRPKPKRASRPVKE